MSLRVNLGMLSECIVFLPPAKSSPPFLGGGSASPTNRRRCGISLPAQPWIIRGRAIPTYARHMKAAPGARYRTQRSGRLGGTRSQHTPTGLSGPQGRVRPLGFFFLLLFLLDSIGASRGKVRLGSFGETFLPGTTVHLHRMEDRVCRPRPSRTHVPTYLAVAQE